VVLPLIEQRTELGGRLLPLHLLRIACGESLDLLDDRGALGDRGIDGGALRGRLLRRGLRQSVDHAHETLLKARQVADRGGAHDLALQLGSLAAQRRRRGSARLVALLDGDDLERQLVELAHVVLQSLVVRAVGVLADDAPVVALADGDDAVLIDPAPLARTRRGGDHGSGRRRGGLGRGGGGRSGLGELREGRGGGHRTGLRCDGAGAVCGVVGSRHGRLLIADVRGKGKGTVPAYDIQRIPAHSRAIVSWG
jgi:hypothetical protein